MSISSLDSAGTEGTGEGRSFSSSRPRDLSLGVTSADWLIPILLGKENNEVSKYKEAQGRALDHPILGPKFGPIPNAKKYVFSPIPEEKFPI